jgi:hypothetical protein
LHFARSLSGSCLEILLKNHDLNTCQPQGTVVFAAGIVIHHLHLVIWLKAASFGHKLYLFELCQDVNKDFANIILEPRR